jgi:hypothetical protein
LSRIPFGAQAVVRDAIFGVGLKLADVASNPGNLDLIG